MAADLQQKLTIEDVMERLGATRAQVYRLVKDGGLVGQKTGRTLRFDAGAVNGFAESQASVGASLKEELGRWLSFFAERLGDKRPSMGLDETAGDSEEELVAKLVRMLFADGVASGATSIHVDPMRDGDRLLYRSEDNLEEIGRIEPALARRLKEELALFAQLAADSESGLKEGFALHALGDKTYQVHVTAAPTPFGEHFHLRTYDSAGLPSLEAMGYSIEQVASLREISRSGLLLDIEPADTVCELHRLAMAREIFAEKPLVLSLEHRFHFRCDRLLQLKVPTAEGDSIDRLWDSILEMGPDVIMIDDVRRPDLAQGLIEAACSGAIVVAQIRSAGVADAIRMLMALGLSGRMISRVLTGIVERISLKKLCPHCRVENPATRRELDLLGISEQRVLFDSPGCEICKDGFYGQRHLFGLLPVSQDSSRSLEYAEPCGEEIFDRVFRNPLSRAAAEACLSGEIAFRQVESLLYRELPDVDRQGK